MLIIRRPVPRPRLSGKRSAALVVICLTVTAILIPVAAHLPHWIEFELVLLAWWMVWTVVLAWVLFQAHVVEPDGEFKRTSQRIALDELGSSGTGEVAGCLLDAGTGCGDVFSWLIAAVVTIIGVFLVVEFLIPGIAFVLYVVVRAMLGRVTDSHRACEGKAGLAMLCGAGWAAVYTAPIGLVVWGVHALSRHPLR